MLNQTFDELKLEKHPEKTMIGRIEKGFDFLGYHISPEGLSLAKKTVENFISRAIRLYEQEPEEPHDSSRLGLYVKHWVRWAGAGFICKNGGSPKAPSFANANHNESVFSCCFGVKTAEFNGSTQCRTVWTNKMRGGSRVNLTSVGWGWEHNGAFGAVGCLRFVTTVHTIEMACPCV